MARFWIGTYTHWNGKANGSLGLYRVEADAAGFHSCTVAAEIRNPSYAALSGDGRFLFAALETEEFAQPGQATVSGGGVASYAVGGDGDLTLLGLRPTGGRAPCHVSEHDGWVFAANYSDGTASVFRHEAGTLSERKALLVHHGSGPNPRRQEGPHAHFAAVTPQGLLCVADLGLDKVMLYRSDSWALEGFAQTLPGTGPRHLAFAEDYAYVVTEMGCTVEVMDARGPGWKRLQSVSTLPEGAPRENNNCAAIHAFGRWIIASNRGHDSLAVFRRNGGSLEPAGIYPCGGREPRDFAIACDGTYIVCGLQNDDALALLSFDAATGIIADTGKRMPVPMPVRVLPG